MKLSDYVMQFIAQLGVGHVFFLPGGGAMHLVDSLGKRKDLEIVCCLHEQAVAIAAQSYAMHTNNLGVGLVTTGPGGTNAITGVCAAWIDSVPCLFVSGQVKRSDIMKGKGNTATGHSGSGYSHLGSFNNKIRGYGYGTGLDKVSSGKSPVSGEKRQAGTGLARYSS